MDLYHCIKFHLLTFNTFRDMLQTSLLLQKIRKGNNSEITCNSVMVLAIPLMAVYQWIKFYLIPFYTFRDMLRTSFLLQKLRMEVTRASVCKTLCPQLPDSNTARFQHSLAMTVTTVQIYEISMLFYLKGNNSKMGDNSDKQKIWVTYFLMRNPFMKFQTSMHISKLMLCIKKCAM